MTEQSNRIGQLGAAVNRHARRFLKRFTLSRKGGVAMIFGLSFIPLSMLTLTAVDFHRASTVRNMLQDALDAASLAAARSDSTNAATIQSIGYNALVANMSTYPDVTVSQATFVLDSDGTVTGDAEAQVTPLVSHMFIGGPIQVGAESEVVRANDKLEIALVLDNTGSMSGTKIATLRTAAANLVDDLEEAASKNTDPDAIKISLVPFSMTVRVGATYQNANWIDNNAVSPQHSSIFDGNGNRFAMLNQMHINWAGCVESRPQPYDVQETSPTASNPSTLFVPYFAPDEPDVPSISGWSSSYDVDNNYLPDGISTKSADYKKWNKHQGRKQKYGTSGLNTSNGRGPNRGCTMEPLARLTTNMNAIKTSISNMGASGNTNIPMGLMWGWHTLSPNAPFGDGASYTDDEVTKVVILMTDGDNVNSDYDNPNDSTYSGLGYIGHGLLGSLGVGSSGSQRTTAMNNRLATLCANMKAQGIVIYTVRVEVSGGASSLLQNCASEAGNFYDVQNVADLGDAFEQIAGQISRLRIAR